MSDEKNQPQGETPKGIHFWVNGIVAVRNGQPYIQLSNEKGMIAQLSMAEARKVAMDILQMASRTEADAMIVKFFEHADLPQGALGALLHEFRNFRMALDTEPVEGSFDPPEET
jgi:hypothetical protein